MSDPDNVSVTTPKHPLTLGAARSVFRPYGEEQTANFNLATLDESKGFIGERFYAEAGLQYLNARYYDPKLGMFIQPDWWEVARAGVGTNRYGYAFGDPVHGRDPTGHSWEGNKHEKPDAPSGGGWSSDRLQRERNGWHDSTYNWSRGSWNVKIGELYISYKVYDSLFGGLAAEKPDLNPGAATRSSKPRVTGPGYQTGVPYNKVTDAIKRTSGLDLSATEDGLSGSIAVGCDLSASFCDRVISGMNSINMTYGRYSIDINFYLNNK